MVSFPVWTIGLFNYFAYCLLWRPGILDWFHLVTQICFLLMKRIFKELTLDHACVWSTQRNLPQSHVALWVPKSNTLVCFHTLRGVSSGWQFVLVCRLTVVLSAKSLFGVFSSSGLLVMNYPSFLWYDGLIHMRRIWRKTTNGY